MSRPGRTTLQDVAREAGVSLATVDRVQGAMAMLGFRPDPLAARLALGERVQIDGSDHRWFEGRGTPCTLVVFIDDATSRLMAMRFVASESTFAYFEVLQDYLARHGKPVAFYSDKHSIFRVAKQDARSGHGVTQFGRALSEPGIEIICANSSQAKGRVERANRTLQGRLPCRTA